VVGVVGDPGGSVTNLFSSAKYKNKLERLSSAGFLDCCVVLGSTLTIGQCTVFCMGKLRP